MRIMAAINAALRKCDNAYSEYLYFGARHHGDWYNDYTAWMPTQIFAVWYFYYQFIHWFSFHVVCPYLGHDMEIDDWGGPESGGTAGTCRRCGWGFSHTFY